MTKSSTTGVLDLALEATRVQLAALNAGIAFWSGWIEQAARFVQSANRELMSIEAGSSKFEDVALKLTDSTREFLRKTTELPQVAAHVFQSELIKSKSKPPSGPRRRAARVKA
jgi:hypothetical protein